MWQDKKVMAAFLAMAKAKLAELAPNLEGQTGVVALEPESGAFFVAETLGKANTAAFAHFPDTWVYFVRLDGPEAAIALPTW
jgi:hypothetical protein